MDPMHRGPQGREGRDSGALARTVQLVADEYLLTVNPVDGSEIEICPPADRPQPPRRHTTEERAALRRSAMPSPPVGEAAFVSEQVPLLDRDEERERLVRLLARGRSVRLTGRPGSGRTVLLNAVAGDCEGLAPDGVIRLSGHRRTPTDLLHELFAAVYHAPWHRLGRAELLDALAEIGAVVILDDVEFGGVALDELLKATPECAFLFSALSTVPSSTSGAGLEEVHLTGISRNAALEILEHTVRRPLVDEETDWAADLWLESEGLPLRFLQAGAVLRQRDARRRATAEGADAASTGDAGRLEGDTTPQEPPALSPGLSLTQVTAGLSPLATRTLRFALALDGELPHQSHLPALVDDPQADTALAELTAAGLASATGSCYRLCDQVATQLTAADFLDARTSAECALRTAQHYAWWAGHPSVTPDRVAAEAGAVLAAVQGAKRGGHPSTAALLAHTAAPVLAAALHWSAWEWALRGGQEAARLAGEVAEEAYFHHELGVLALCVGNFQRAQAELEASIGMRGALADKRGAVAGRRALALVEDRTTLAGSGAAAAAVPGVATAGAHGRPYAAASEPGSTPRAGTPSPFLGAPDLPGPTGVKPTAAEERRSAVFGNRRRKFAVVGVGAVLAATLGAVMTLGNTTGEEPDDGVKPNTSTSHLETDASPSEAPEEDSASYDSRPEPSEDPTTSGSPSPSPTDEESPSPTEDPTTPTDDPTTPTEDPTTPTDDPTTPTDDPTTPTDDPSTPTDDPSTPTDDPTDPEDPEPSETTSTSQSPSTPGTTGEPSPSSTPTSPAPSASPPERSEDGSADGSDEGLTIH